MKRSKPLKRSWLRRGKRRSAYSKRERDLDYMLWVKAQPCCLCGKAWRSEAHHAGKRAFGRKAPDDTVIPLCPPCHRDIPLLTHWMSKTDRREWLDDQIAEHRSRYLAENGGL